MTPETTALVERLREAFESLWFLYPEETFEAPLSRSWEEARQAVDAAVTALSQERTCSTCKWLKEHAIENYAGKGLHCDHIDSAAYELERDCVSSWGCLLWEQADAEEVRRL
jgi:hypothetical protein